MNKFGYANKFIYALILGLIGAVIVHIVVLFMVPSYAQDNAWSHLTKDGGMYHFFDVSPSNPIRQSTDPLLALKACRFNLSDGPVHIEANPSGQFWSLSIYNREGINFYSLNNQATPDGTLDLVIGDAIQIMELKKTELEAIENSVLIREDMSEGFVILRNFDKSNTQNNINQNFTSEELCKTLDY